MFNLTSLIRSVMDDTEETDTDKLTEIVFPMIPAEEHAEIVRKLLRGFVRDMQGRDWNSVRIAKPAESIQAWVDDDNDPQMLPVVKSRPKAMSRWRVAVRDTVISAYLDATTDVNGVRKRRGEMTVDDLMVAAAQRRDLASANLGAAEELDSLADLLEEHGVLTVSLLPSDILKKLAERK